MVSEIFLTPFKATVLNFSCEGRKWVFLASRSEAKAHGAGPRKLNIAHRATFNPITGEPY